MLAVAPELVGPAAVALEPIAERTPRSSFPTWARAACSATRAPATQSSGNAVLDDVVTRSGAMLETAEVDDPEFRPCTPADRGDRMTTFRAGAASLLLEPPLGLPMVGFIRQPWTHSATGCRSRSGRSLLERGKTRVILCGVDIVGIIHPRSSRCSTASPRRPAPGARDPPQPQPHPPRADRRPSRRRHLRRARR